MTLSKFTNQPANEEIVTTINDIIDTMGSTTGANIDLSNLSQSGQDKFDAKVNKSGDTMTGDLTIQFADLDLTTTVSSNTYKGIELVDTNGNRVGRLECFQRTNGQYGINIGSKYGTFYPKIELDIDSNGNASCTFPNTTCCDGQYVHAYQSIVTGLNINNSSNTNTGWYSLSLPNDSYSYLVWINCHVTTGSTSGNYGIARVISDIETVGISGAGARTRTSSSQFSETNVVIPVDSNHRVKFVRNSNWNATADFTMVGYRRIGTNL